MCPRAHGYENKNRYMKVETAMEIRNQLAVLDYKGMISISGMGEPFLNKDLLNICTILKDFNLQVITNGTLPRDYHSISEFAQILVSVHDWSNIENYRKRFEGVPAIFRNNDPNHLDCELKITNRGGWNNKDGREGPCNYPFYKTLIDYDGCYLLCADDWKRVSKKENVNVSNVNIKDYFCNYLREVKNQAIEKGRLYEPCRHCNTDGRLIGSNIVEWYKKCQLKKESMQSQETTI